MLRLNHDDSSKASLYYSCVTFVRYFFEICSAPVLGQVSDIYGRRLLFITSLLVSSFEGFMLALFPSIWVIFLTRMILGLGDCGIATAFTMSTDISVANGEDVTAGYGYLGAAIGIAFILGPSGGGILCEYSLELCLLLGASLAVMGAVLAYFLLEETLHFTAADSKQRDFVDTEAPSVVQGTVHGSETSKVAEDDDCLEIWRRANPFPALKQHFSHKRLRQLSYPLIVSSMASSGTSYIWFLFMDYRFHSSTTEIGVFLSVYGVVGALVQGVVVPRVVGVKGTCGVSEATATVGGLVLSALQVVAFGLCRHEWGLYVVVLVFGLNTVYEPALRALIVTESRLTGGEKHQGNLQGTLGSMRTLASAFGSVLFTSVFAKSIDMKPRVPMAAFLLAAAMLMGCAVYVYSLLWGGGAEGDRGGGHGYTAVGEDGEEVGDAGSESNVERTLQKRLIDPEEEPAQQPDGAQNPMVDAAGNEEQCK